MSRPSEEELLEWMESLSNWGRWGADDQLGTLNLIDREVTSAAVGVVQDGVTVSCARRISFKPSADTKLPPLHMMLKSGDVYRPGEGPDWQVAADYVAMAMHGHAITHVDSLSHFFWDGRMYNGVPSTEVTIDRGARSHGVDVASRGVVSRGVLVDVPRLRGVEYVKRGEGVGPDDLALAASQCGVELRRGDVLLVRTGQLTRSAAEPSVDPAVAGSAGISPELLPLIRHRDVAMLGSDTANEVLPTGYARLSRPIHQVGIVAMGLWMLDNADLEDLASACAERGRWEFLFSTAPLRLSYSTGSPVNPIAVL